MSKKIVLALCALLLVATTPALADDDSRRGRDRERHWHDHDRGDGAKRHYKYQYTHHYKHHGKHHGKHYKVYRGEKHRHDDYAVVWDSGRHWNPPAHGHRKAQRHVHRHHHRPAAVHRHGHKHHAYRQRRHDDWALYAILALQIVDALNESQRDSYARARERAATAPLGDTIRWHDGAAQGSVIPTRDGADAAGRYCREFQQEVIVGNRRQSGYGVACRQPDGDWEIVS